MGIIDVSKDVYKDTGIDIWMSSNVILKSSKDVMRDIMLKPNNDDMFLKERQRCLSMNDITHQLEYIKQYEDEVEWALNIENEIDNNIMNIVFPMDYYNIFINYSSYSLELYHSYRIYSLPFIHLSSPISMIVAPYYILKKMNINVSISWYMNYLWKMVKLYVNTNGDIQYLMIRWVSFIIYCLLYIYGIYNTFEFSYMLHDIRQRMITNIEGVSAYVRIAKILLNVTPSEYWEPFTTDGYFDDTLDISGEVNDIFYLWTNMSNSRDRLKKLIHCINGLDVANCVRKLYMCNSWCRAVYSDNTKFVDMKNPILSSNQISNPVLLDKNMIVTGPNAAGKTTYVKSIVTNIILSQTIGVCMCTYAEVKLYSGIQTFMRVNDELGSASYFETEVKYCKNMLNLAEENPCSNLLFIMDEPMHSTPPIEGQSTAYGVLKYMANRYTYADVIITTHYHNLVILEEEYPEYFRNVSMEAIEVGNREYRFPYKLNKGFSKQCIAIELLGREMFPEDIIESAIELKNKICNS